MSSASLSIPIAFWTRGISTATISTTLACATYVVAGFEDGLIWVFHDQGDSAVTLQPRTLLVGHKARITALASILVEGDTNQTSDWILFSASEDGEVKKWSLTDGRCLQSNPTAFIGVPTYLGAFTAQEKTSSASKFIVCAGMANEACILDSTSLEVVRVWGGHQEWVYCTTLPPDDQHQCRILSVTSDCKLSLWIFDTQNMAVVRSKDFEICVGANESLVSLVASEFDPCLVVLLTRNCAQIVCFHPQRKACLVIPSSEGDSFIGAAFLCANNIVLWAQSGTVHVHSIKEIPQAGEMPQAPSTIAIQSEGSSYTRAKNLTFALVFARPPVRLIAQVSDVKNTRAQWSSNDDDRFPLPTITCTAMLNDSTLALGRANGEVWVASIEDALSWLVNGFPSEPTKNVKRLKGHVGPITSLFSSADLMERSFLLTGGADCSARIWNIESGHEVACFNNHSRPVSHFLQVPEDVHSRIRKSVISVAKDNSVAIISIEEMNCIYLFGGYEHALVSIQWRPAEDFIVLCHADGTAFVWEMQTSHLDRIVKGETTREIMKDPRWSVCEISNARSHSSKLAFDCITVRLNKTVHIQVLLVNVKNVLNILSNAKLGEIQHGDTSSFNGASSHSQEAPPTPRRRRLFSGQPKVSDIKRATKLDAPPMLSNKASQVLNATKAVLALLITEEDAHAVSIRALLGLQEPSKTITLGMRGAYGNISVQAPLSDNNARDSWCVSSTLSASKLIAISALSKAVASALRLDVDMDTWSKGFCSAVQDSVGSKFCSPSLSYLTKYWQDPQSEIQEATKVILLSTVERMSKPDIAALVKYWSAFLPAAALPDTCSSQYMARSAIILGILGAGDAEALPERIRKLVALSLTILLNDDSRLSYKIASIDLLAQGFASWQPFIRTDAVLKTLFSLATSTIAEAQALANSTGLVSRRARRAVTQIAGVNPALFVATLTQEIMEAKKPAERMGLLKLISIFSRKSPTVLYNGIPRLSEAIVKSLDPTVPSIREALLPVATSVLLDLVQSFPQLDFHAGSQKLAVGTLEGAIVVYDVQTATRWQILEGHLQPVSALSFSRDGKTIVSCSVKEGRVRFWHPNPGFFGMLLGSGGGGGFWGGGGGGGGSGGTSKHVAQGSSGSGSGVGIPSLSSQQSSRSFDFALQDSIVTGSEETLLGHIRFEWSGDRVVKLSVYDHLMSFNV